MMIKALISGARQLSLISQPFDARIENSGPQLEKLQDNELD